MFHPQYLLMQPFDVDAQFVVRADGHGSHFMRVGDGNVVREIEQLRSFVAECFQFDKFIRIDHGAQQDPAAEPVEVAFGVFKLVDVRPARHG